MAEQLGPIKFRGSMGGLVFFSRNGRHFARLKGGPTRDQIKNKPSYAKTRKHNDEMAACGKAVKLIRQAFRKQFNGTADKDMTCRLAKKIWEIIKSDKNHEHGSRRIVNGDIGLLNGFGFNNNTDLQNILSAQFTSSMDRKTGSMTVHFPSFVPARDLWYPASATHVRLTSCVAELDFEAEEPTVTVQTREGDFITVDSSSASAITMTSFLHNTSKPLLMTLSIQFFQQVRGRMYPINGAAYKAMSIVQVDGKEQPPS